VEAVLGYASDPAALTQAYVANKLGLRGNSVKSIFLLSNKNEFRRLQQENNLSTPTFQTFSSIELKNLKNSSFDYPVVVKPVDASDTKGVFKVENNVELTEKAEMALSFSRAKKVIIEEYIDAVKGNLHGDAFFADGEMIFCMLGDRLFYSYSSPLKPTVDFYPSRLPRHFLELIEKERFLLWK
jgi:biotin carboxylase